MPATLEIWLAYVINKVLNAENMSEEDNKEKLGIWTKNLFCAFVDRRKAYDSVCQSAM